MAMRMMSDGGSATSPSLISSLWNAAKQTNYYKAGSTLFNAAKVAGTAVYDQVKEYNRTGIAPADKPSLVTPKTPTNDYRQTNTSGGSGGGTPAPSSGGGGSTAPAYTPPPAPTPAAASPDFLSFEDYKQSLIDAVKGGIMADYEANAVVINNNLTKALSDLEAEQAALDPLYQKQLKNIGDRKYATTVQQRELMNQAGWNATNSGLAVGEHTRIANQASEETADADASYNQYMTDILRRKTVTKQTSADSLAALDREKNAKLSGAEASALVQADDRNRDIYTDDRNFNESQRQFNEQQNLSKAQFEESKRQWQKNYDLNAAEFKESQRRFNVEQSNRNASQKLADAKDATKFTDQEVDNMTTSSFSWIMRQKDPMKSLDTVLADKNIPTKVKQNILSLMQSNKTLRSTGSSGSGIQLTTD